MSIYEENGYKNRNDYLASLAAEYSADPEFVVALAEALGTEEDFDGLVTSVQDML